MKRGSVEDGNKRMPLSTKNYYMMLAGVIVIVIGFILMSGGGDHTATEFDESIFSFRRITLAPIVVIAGFVLEIFAIMKRFDKGGENSNDVDGTNNK
ncbi:MAG: DUF3098 domain-containing protein [Alistipes sp.]|nr:DUF3098 domain-containing protein [Alistipes sp.]